MHIAAHATLKLADFGTSLVLREEDTIVEQMGSPPYMAPEVCSGNDGAEAHNAYTYIHTHIYINTYTHIYTYSTYIQYTVHGSWLPHSVHSHNSNTYIHTYIHTYVRTYIHTYIFANITHIT